MTSDGRALVGRYRERLRARGRNLEDYDFYPFLIDRDNFPQFDLAAFRRGVDHLLRHSDAMAVRQLIFIGEQNEVRHQLGRDALADYERLYARYGGERLAEDHNEFLENYTRIVRLIGRTFRDIPIYRREFGLVAALCINIDVNYVADHVRASPERIEEFLAKYALTEMPLEENILSRDEYLRAVNGKRHWLDAAYLASRQA